MRLLPRTLTTRLVLSAVALVALVGVLVATSATLAMRGYLNDRLDGQVQDALRRANGPRQPDFPGAPTLGDARFVQPGLLTVFVPTGSEEPVGYAFDDQVRQEDASRQRAEDVHTLTAAEIAAVTSVPVDDSGHSVRVNGRQYRVMTDVDSLGNTVAVGLSTHDVDETVSSMVSWFALLTLLGVLLAGGVGVWLVRRQLRPLTAVAHAAREVADQDLSSGEAEIATRVAPELTHEDTEVGQVGAALNTLLAHVDSALTARHRSEQQVRQFVADASHELRTPLATIHGYAELARRTPEDADALTAALSKVETEAGRMSGLVEDLLLLARLDAGRPLAREEVDLTRLLLEAVADARVLAPDHQWRLELPEEPLTLIGDAGRLHQVVTNLLNNARSHTPAGTTVTVAADADPGQARITVHDDGPGLGPDLAGDAFKRFTRGDSSRTRASGGAGLGLSLVSAIAEAHGGTAAVASSPGDTTFTVSVPLTPPEMAPAAGATG